MCIDGEFFPKEAQGILVYANTYQSILTEGIEPFVGFIVHNSSPVLHISKKYCYNFLIYIFCGEEFDNKPMPVFVSVPRLP